MSTTINLDSINDENDPDATQGEADIFQILKQGLSSEADSATGAAQLAESLRVYIHDQAAGSRKVANDLLWDLWPLLVQVVTFLPIDHPWQDCLITTVDKLRREGGRIIASDDSEQWADLPGLSMYLVDKWADPSKIGDSTSEDVEAWKRLNSFASRLLADDFRHWIPLAWWEITAGLETASQDPTEFEWRLWVVTEWLIQCGDLLFKDLSSPEELDSGVLASVRPGPLCADVHPMSLQRWEFWLSRLMELSSGRYTVEGGSKEVELSASSISRIEQAIGAMRRHASSSNAQDQS
ncbi:unnamed protein product [Penicillium salamii]|uniref:Uncharacterized protein n=1 Tax=Penicillium salamii TaxID=1612424 RepID=A0A9W4NF96_9EURO|nr:unnamed protein product [Penicillium salamii]CAG8170734.1 unnamed protein product [Penicillium salamii]CAG8225687.1 unnamed protein product [Penicillium salamii]CAG8319710.1 unnamed protein product [Penicillium salamii]CAG8371758.1 unnamed protein product [Penicillium salamii]